MTQASKTGWQTFTEEIEIAGAQLVDEINRLIAKGNVNKIQIATGEGDIFLDVPVTAAAVAGGVVVLAAPWLALIAAIAGVVAQVKVTIVRDVQEPPAEPADAASEAASRAATPTKPGDPEC